MAKVSSPWNAYLDVREEFLRREEGLNEVETMAYGNVSPNGVAKSFWNAIFLII
jgi:hypothetical protein